MNRVMSKITRFLRDDRSGSVAVEATMVFPVFVWVYLGMFVYWEAFRVENTNTKAAYLLADVLSREFNPLTDDYIDGMGNLYAFLTRDRFPTSIRVSSIGWDATNGKYVVLWSRATNGGTQLVSDDVADKGDVLPVIPAGDTVILVETRLDYVPTFNIGLDPRQMTQFVYMRPRFISAVPFEGVDNSNYTGSTGGLGTDLGGT